MLPWQCGQVIRSEVLTLVVQKISRRRLFLILHVYWRSARVNFTKKAFAKQVLREGCSVLCSAAD